MTRVAFAALAVAALVLSSCGGGSATHPEAAGPVLIGTISLADREVSAGSTGTIATVTLRDKAGNPAPGVAVRLAMTGSDNSIAQPQTLTNADGVATGTVASTRAESKVVSATANEQAIEQTATLTVIAGAPAALSFIAEPPASATAGEVFGVAVHATDAYGNATATSTAAVQLELQGGDLSTAFFGGEGASAVAGIASFDALSVTLAATDYSLVAKSESLASATSQTFAITPAAPSPSTSEVAAEFSTRAAGETTGLTAHVRDEFGNAVPGVTVTFSATGTSNELAQPLGPTSSTGEITGSLRSTFAESKTVTAAVEGQEFDSSAHVTFVAGAASPSGSALSADPASANDDGSLIDLVATIGDAYGNPIDGATVVFTSDGPASFDQPASASGADGQASGHIRGGAPGPQTVSATVDSAEVAQAEVVFTATPVSASVSTVTASATDVAPGISVTISVTVMDAAGHSLAGRAVSLSYSGSASIASSPIVTDTSGVATFSLAAASDTQGFVEATVSAASDQVTLDAKPQVVFALLLAPFSAMVRVPGAESFPFGTDDGGTCTSVNYAYWMAPTEVTCQQWSLVYAWAIANGYTFANPGRCGGFYNTGTATYGTFSSGHDTDPVTTINWRDALIWCNALTEYENAQRGTSLDCVYKSGGTPIRDATDATTCDAVVPDTNAKGFRLPTSMEWELAARYRDGTTWTPGSYASGASADYTHSAANDAVAWYSANSNYSAVNLFSTQPVGHKTANDLTLRDMSGNVWEWCADVSGSTRVLRGGSWYHPNTRLQLGYIHTQNSPANALNDAGFRFVKTE